MDGGGGGGAYGVEGWGDEGDVVGVDLLDGLYRLERRGEGGRDVRWMERGIVDRRICGCGCGWGLCKYATE